MVTGCLKHVGAPGMGKGRMAAWSGGACHCFGHGSWGASGVSARVVHMILLELAWDKLRLESFGYG
jgi:hypothetical protein